MVDRDGLENRCTREGTVGSNPTLSASFLAALGRWRFGWDSGSPAGRQKATRGCSANPGLVAWRACLTESVLFARFPASVLGPSASGRATE